MPCLHPPLGSCDLERIMRQTSCLMIDDEGESAAGVTYTWGSIDVSSVFSVN